MGCFLPQALDWIQETGEFYLSTHTSTGETTEETQELLKEYGEFRVPAKVGNIPDPSPNPPRTLHSGQFHIMEAKTASVSKNTWLQWQGGKYVNVLKDCLQKPEYPKNCSCWVEQLYAGSQLLYTVLPDTHLHAPGSGICYIISDQIREKGVFM